MIFGDPYRFAIFADLVSDWGEAFHNGLLYVFINGKMYPDDIRTSTLSVDLPDLLDESGPLIQCPVDVALYNKKSCEAFSLLMGLTFPESSEDDEYPEQCTDFWLNVSNVSSSGMAIFAVSNGENLRVLGAKTEVLVKIEGEDKNHWVKNDEMDINEVIIPNDEIRDICHRLDVYTNSIFKNIDK